MENAQSPAILPFLRKRGMVFDDLTTNVLGEAYDAACKALHDTGQPAIVYEVIAQRILDAAGLGERDPTKLRKIGLAAFLNDSDDDTCAS
jgi:hypothetical protein